MAQKSKQFITLEHQPTIFSYTHLNSVRWKPSCESRRGPTTVPVCSRLARRLGLISKSGTRRGCWLDRCICKSILPGCIVENGCREPFLGRGFRRSSDRSTVPNLSDDVTSPCS